MSRTEDRLQDALSALAGQVRDERLRPLPAPDPRPQKASQKRLARLADPGRRRGQCAARDRRGCRRDQARRRIQDPADHQPGRHAQLLRPVGGERAQQPDTGAERFDRRGDRDRASAQTADRRRAGRRGGGGCARRPHLLRRIRPGHPGPDRPPDLDLQLQPHRLRFGHPADHGQGRADHQFAPWPAEHGAIWPSRPTAPSSPSPSTASTG